ncbi:nuclear transport factor 2 family protein [Cytophaga aurantiaca]|uniref:nuclear transport factor 2 family protein n=1 Tax=Cytophaga aurantiaca TaxID=29530 RepID=UPI00035CF37E|nr:nuclear transport factor 2 family protein [Cytophaga aurantiaca]
MLHQELLEHFYHSFKSKDAEGMISCYHDHIVFTDPAFGTLTGAEAKNMWRMLLGQNSSLTIDYNNISADANTGRAHWKAEYVFSKTKRPVVNKVTSTFEFKDGKIIRQIDMFDLNLWAKQALGYRASILNFFGILPTSIKRKAKESLQRFSEKNK